MTRGPAAEQTIGIGLDPFTVPVATHSLATAPLRARVVVEGTVWSVSTARWAGGPAIEVTLGDSTGMLTLVFFGARGVAGVEPGRRLVAAGAVGTHRGERVILSPQLWLAAHRVPEPTRMPVAHEVVHSLVLA
jgi:RecG-like helicase